MVTPPLLLLAIDDNILEFGQEVARNLHDPEIASSVTGVFALEQEQTQLAREASALIPVLATGEARGLPDLVAGDRRRVARPSAVPREREPSRTSRRSSPR